MYFASPSQWHGGRQITLETGASPWRGFFGYGSRLPGPRVEERRHALSEANIFDLHYLDDELATFKEKGFSIEMEGRVEILQDFAISQNALHMCADAVLFRLLMEEPIAAAFRDRVPGQFNFYGAARVLVPLKICHAVLTDIVEMFPSDNEGRVLKDSILCAQNVLERLGRESARSLTDQDDDALSSLR